MTDVSNTPGFDGSNFNIDQMDRLIADVGPDVNAVEETPTQETTAKDAKSKGAEFKKEDQGEELVSEEESDVEDADEQEEPDSELEDNEEEDEKPLRSIKAKLGDKEIEVPEEAVVQVKVNGKLVDVQVKDLAADYSGRTEIQRRFTELDNERKTFTKEKDTFVQHKNEVSAHLDMMAALEPEEFVHHLAHLKGVDPDELFGNMVKRTIELVQKMQQLTPEMREVYNENRKLKIQQSLQKKAQEIQQKSQAELQKEQSVNSRREQVFKEMDEMGLTKDDFIAAAEQVAKLIDKGELTGDFNEFDILDWAREEKLLTVINDHVNVELPKATPEYRQNVRKAIKAEEAYLGRYLTPDEVATVVTRLINKNREAVKKNLSTDAAKAATPQRARFKAANTKEEELAVSEFLSFMGRR